MHKPYNDSMSATVVAACDCSESLLSGCVPLQSPLSKHAFIIPPIISNLLRPSIQLLCASDCSKDSSSDCTIVTIYTTYRKQWSPCELPKGIPWSIVQSKRNGKRCLQFATWLSSHPAPQYEFSVLIQTKRKFQTAKTFNNTWKWRWWIPLRGLSDSEGEVQSNAQIPPHSNVLPN
jgi:hypothetical protein